MDLNDIHIAVAVGREGSVSAAAIRLGLTPGTVSKAISRLERQVKVQLFERLARGMRPTEIGAAFLRQAQSMDLAAEDLYAQMRDLRQAKAGTLRIGLGNGIPDRFVLPVIGQLVERGVHVQVSGGMTDSLRREVALGDLDFAVFGLFQPPEEGLAWIPLTFDPMVPMIPKEHPLMEYRRAVPWKELAKARWIVTGRQTSSFREYEQNFDAHGLKAPTPTVFSQSSLREVALAITTNAVVLMPQSMTADANAAKLSPLHPVGGWLSERHIGLAYRDGGYVGPAAQQAIKKLSEIFKNKV
jgi:LysR family transcriptional regulator, regulator of abg operon